MNTAHSQTKREMEKKEARVAFLKKEIISHTVPALQQLDGGFYMSAAAHLDAMASASKEISTLLNEIQQLYFTLERLEAEQTHLPLGEEVPA